MAGVTQVTDRSPMLSSGRGRAAALASALLRGAIAAGLGLGTLTVLLMGLWISSPYSDAGPGRAVRTAAALWLLSHGAELVRTDTLSHIPAPVATVPLLLMVLPVWLLHRAARDALEAADPVGPVDTMADRPPSAAAVCCAVVTGYLLVVAGAVAFVRSAPLRVDSATLAFPLVAVVAGAAAAGVWTASGRPLGATPSWAPLRVQEAVARTLFRDRAEAATRSAVAGIAVLLGGGALLVAIGLVRNRTATEESFLALADEVSGQVAVLLLALALVPNAAVWAASYGLGPGFSLGTTATVAPLGFHGDPALPGFPLLAALPDPGPGTVVNGATGVVPLMAAVAVAWFTVRRAAPSCGTPEDAWSPGETALVTALAALGCGAGTAALAALSGGPMGTRALAEFGPVWWLTGAAAAIWTVVLGVPLALLMRTWRLRERAWGWRWETADDTRMAGLTGAGAGAGAARVVPGAAAVPERRAWSARGLGSWRTGTGSPDRGPEEPTGESIGVSTGAPSAHPSVRPTEDEGAGDVRAWWSPLLPRRKSEAPDAGTAPARPAPAPPESARSAAAEAATDAVVPAAPERHAAATAGPVPGGPVPGGPVPAGTPVPAGPVLAGSPVAGPAVPVEPGGEQYDFLPRSEPASRPETEAPRPETEALRPGEDTRPTADGAAT
ncbi:cell division protein PerM [Streptomyces sp. NPDC001493]